MAPGPRPDQGSAQGSGGGASLRGNGRGM